MSKDRIVKYEGELPLGGNTIPCYVLNDGTRVLSSRAMQTALKMVDEEEGKQTAGTRLTRHLSQKTLNPFIFKDKDLDHFKPLICFKGDTKIHGYEATILVDICDGFLEARRNIHLSTRQEIIAKECEILMRSFAKVGIIALVDEATGYQYEREKFELQAVLKELISDEILKWQEAFHLSFYKEIFRLWNIPFTQKNINRKPQFIGHLTNKFVYENLPKGTFVLDKLKEKTPRTSGGNYKYRLHQSLTPEKGRETLKKVIYSVEALASIAETKRQFLKLMEEKYGQKEIPFQDLEDKVETKKIDKPNDFDKTLKGILSVPLPSEKR